MANHELRKRAHDLDATVRVGKRGVEAVVDEVDDQLSDRRLVKVKFLRAARGGTTVEDLAADLAGRIDAEVFRTRGNTAVVRR